MKKKTQEDSWLTLQEACDYLKISKETMYRKIYAKKIPFSRLGKLYRFKSSQLDKAVR